MNTYTLQNKLKCKVIPVLITTQISAQYVYRTCNNNAQTL